MTEINDDILDAQVENEIVKPNRFKLKIEGPLMKRLITKFKDARDFINNKVSLPYYRR